ncbi:hypothetical protein MA16_Dca023546 [Dendrobium catenatum]|uniref:Uncharacterized protein n=1 Tax=Dendrobium catenatum TaxID=906689 RepID=A0A2I0VHP6_9ASPA|nr:hypothetical protein MA16_Dca023546 [Dendrobium catenatum]
MLNKLKGEIVKMMMLIQLELMWKYKQMLGEGKKISKFSYLELGNFLSDDGNTVKLHDLNEKENASKLINSLFVKVLVVNLLLILNIPEQGINDTEKDFSLVKKKKSKQLKDLGLISTNSRRRRMELDEKVTMGRSSPTIY